MAVAASQEAKALTRRDVARLRREVALPSSAPHFETSRRRAKRHRELREALAELKRVRGQVHA